MEGGARGGVGWRGRVPTERSNQRSLCVRPIVELLGSRDGLGIMVLQRYTTQPKTPKKSDKRSQKHRERKLKNTFLNTFSHLADALIQRNSLNRFQKYSGSRHQLLMNDSNYSKAEREGRKPRTFSNSCQHTVV